MVLEEEWKMDCPCGEEEEEGEWEPLIEVKEELLERMLLSIYEEEGEPKLLLQ